MEADSTYSLRPIARGPITPRDSDLSRLFAVARRRAQHYGIPEELTCDYEAELAEKLVCNSVALLHYQQQGWSDAWLTRCADNYAKDFLRRWHRIQRTETPWPVRFRKDGSYQEWEAADIEADPERTLLYRELTQQMLTVVSYLSPIQQDLFHRHVQCSESPAEIGLALGRTPHAVRQALGAIRKRVRALLEQAGFTEAEVRAYLISSGWHHHQRRTSPMRVQ